MTAKDLYQTSVNEMKAMLPSDAADFRLEEAIWDEYAKKWRLVVSYLLKVEIPISTVFGNPVTQFNPKYDRFYKRVEIAEDGRFVGFKMYEDR